MDGGRGWDDISGVILTRCEIVAVSRAHLTQNWGQSPDYHLELRPSHWLIPVPRARSEKDLKPSNALRTTILFTHDYRAVL